MKYLKTILFFIVFLLIINFILSLLFYFDIISTNTNNIFKIIFLIIDLLASGFIIGRAAQKKGYIEGLKIAGILIVISILLSLIFKYPIELKNIVVYLLSVFGLIIGSSIGINFKEKKN